MKIIEISSKKPLTALQLRTAEIKKRQHELKQLKSNLDVQRIRDQLNRAQKRQTDLLSKRA